MALAEEARDPYVSAGGVRSVRTLAQVVRRLDVVLVFCCALVPLARFTNATWTSFNGDPFTYLYDASRIVHGQVPFRDFFSFVGPGSLWLPATWMALFGVSAAAAQVLLVVALALLAAVLYALGLRLTRRRLLSLFAPAFVILAVPAHFPWPYHHWYGMTMALTTLLTLSGWLADGRQRWLVLTGVGCAATVLLEQTYGVALVIALTGLLALHPQSLATTARSVGSLALGLGLGLAPVVGYFAYEGALYQLFYDTLVFPNRHLIVANEFPFAGNLSDWLNWGVDPTANGRKAIVYHLAAMWSTLGIIGVSLLTLVPAGLLILESIVGRLRRVPVPPDAQRALLLACSLATVVTFLLTLHVRQDMIHLVWATLLAYPTLIGFLGQVETPFAARAIGCMLTSLVAAAAAWFLILTGVPTTVSIDQMASRDPLTVYLRDHTAPGDEIAIVGVGGQHYFYSRPAAIGYTQVIALQDVNTPAQLREIRGQIEERRPKLAVFRAGLSCTAVPDRSGCVIPLPSDYQGTSGPLPDRLIADGATWWIYTRQ